MAELSPAFGNRVRNQAPAVRDGHRARRVDPPVTARKRWKCSWLEGVAGAAIPNLRGEQSLVTHSENGSSGTSMIDSHGCHQLHQSRARDPSAEASQITADD